MGGAKIGNNCYLEDSFIDPGFLFLIEIGDNVTITHATLLAHDASTQHAIKKSKVGKIVIGSNVFIGYGAIVLPNVKIGDNCVIGAGTVVSKDIPNNSIVCGNPCKVIGTYSEFVDKNKKAMKRYPVWSTYHAYKSEDEIEQMKRDLDGCFGFDE